MAWRGLVGAESDRLLGHAMDKSEVRDLIGKHGTDLALSRMRLELSYFAAEVFSDVGQELLVVGHVLGSDRVTGASPVNRRRALTTVRRPTLIMG